MTSIILLLIGISIVIYLLYLSLHEEDRFKKLALITIVAGAIGNIIDRGMDGYVTDFLHLKINDFSFFIFNLADAFISIGAIIIIFFELKSSSSYDKAN
jgi:signal peptidase II